MKFTSLIILLIFLSSFTGGEIKTKKKYYPNKTIKSECIYKIGSPEKYLKSFYENGEIMSEGKLKGKRKEKNKSNLKAKYSKTQKNEQVKEFYNRCSFSLAESTDTVRNYTLDINNYKPKQLNYIEIINDK